MNLQDFQIRIKGIEDELNRLSSIIDEPERILGEFYERLRPNFLIQIVGLQGISEAEVYDILIKQLQKLPLMENCRIDKTDAGLQAPPLLISFRHPDFSLVRIDLKSRKYENIYLSVLRGIDACIKEAGEQRSLARERVNEIMTLDKDIRTLADGDLKLNKPGAWAKKNNIRSYLKRNGYLAQDAKQIVLHLEKFLDNCQTEIDKRNATLAEHQRTFSEQSERRSQFDDNQYLQNTINDIVELLDRNGYQEERILA